MPQHVGVGGAGGVWSMTVDHRVGAVAVNTHYLGASETAGVATATEGFGFQNNRDGCSKIIPEEGDAAVVPRSLR